MTEEIHEHLLAAEDSLTDANILLQNDRFNATVNRAYYTMLHAATALLLHHNVERSSHQAVIAAFGQFLAKPGIIDTKYHRYLRETYDLRLAGDYNVYINIKPDEAELVASRAQDFLDQVKLLLDK